MSDWKPGDLALVNGRVCINTVDGWEHGDPRAFRYQHTPGLDIRPLIALDLNDHFVTQRLGEAYCAVNNVAIGPNLAADRVEAALREFANPTPRIEEPTGLGAVVEDADGKRWVRTNQPRYPWSDEPERDEDGDGTWECCLFSDVKAVRILTPGVPS